MDRSRQKRDVCSTYYSGFMLCFSRSRFFSIDEIGVLIWNAEQRDDVRWWEATLRDEAGEKKRMMMTDASTLMSALPEGNRPPRWADRFLILLMAHVQNDGWTTSMRKMSQIFLRFQSFPRKSSNTSRTECTGVLEAGSSQSTGLESTRTNQNSSLVEK